MEMNGENRLNRRVFFGVLAAAVWVLFFGKKNAAARPPELVPTSLCRCPIAGLQYYQGSALLAKLKKGQRLILKREPANPHDRLAIAVYTAARDKLGYLPRRLNEIPASLMDSGHRLEAVITTVNRDVPLWGMVEVGVVLAAT
jgi:hypothetical protein